jgi:hypothetical protein
MIYILCSSALVVAGIRTTDPSESSLARESLPLNSRKHFRLLLPFHLAIPSSDTPGTAAPRTHRSTLHRGPASRSLHHLSSPSVSRKRLGTLERDPVGWASILGTGSRDGRLHPGQALRVSPRAQEGQEGR